MTIDINELREIGATMEELSELLDRLEAAEKELAELRSSMKFRTSLIGRTEAERDALRTAVRHESDCVDAAKAEIEALRAKIEAMEKQEPVGYMPLATKAALEAGGTGVVWNFRDRGIADEPLYALPVAQGEEK